MNNVFDPSAKENKSTLDYFENKSWLIIESSASTRSSIKKSISQLGSKISNMMDAENFNDAMNIIETKNPHYILGNKNIAGGTIIALLEAHMKRFPNRLQSGFFVVTEENSMSEMAIALNYDMDGIISVPFTGAAIINTLHNGVKHKIAPSNYVKKFEEGRQSYLQENYDIALDVFQDSIILHPHPYESYFYIAEIYKHKNLTDKAITAFEESISHNPQYYKGLRNLGLLYSQQKNYKRAYEVNIAMAEKYPISPDRIPEMMRLSIINQKYSDINNYLRIFYSMQSPSVELQNHVAAGMTVLGKYFINSNEIEKAVDTLRVALTYSSGKYEILKSITKYFQEIDRPKDLLAMMDKINLAEWPETAEGFYFYTLHLSSDDDQQVMAYGEKLLKRKIPNVLIFKGLIERGIRMKRKQGTLESLVFEAINAFPNNKEEFDLLLNEIQSKSES